MQCCVLFCETTAEIGSESAGITFHEFPREVQLRAAWLRALGKQDSRLPDSAVVCSLHFLNDDIYETANGLKQLRTGAIPSTVQVCMICLDTDGKMLLMSKHKLDEAYEQLTNHPPYDLRNLKQTLCIQCAQRLINFSRFRDKSLKARTLMMDLVEQHKLITRQHITMINRTKHRLNSDTVSTKLEPDHYELHILEQLSEDVKIEIEETVNRAAVKTEGSCGSTSADEDKEAIVKDDHSVSVDVIKDPLKCESAPFHCTLCLEEFVHEHAYMRHMTMHLQRQRLVLPGALAIHSDTFRRPAAQQLHEEPATSAHPAPARTGTAATAAATATTATTKRAVKGRRFTCNICQNKCNCQNRSMIKRHTKIHTEKKKTFICEFCGYKCESRNDLVRHLRAHTGEKPYSCNFCKFKSARKSNLITHMRTHTDEKPHACKLCSFKSARKNNLVMHMRTHTGEKPNSCQLCGFKCAERSSLKRHMRTHTGEKPYACKLCEFKSAQKVPLLSHMRTHTGEKSLSCS